MPLTLKRDLKHNSLNMLSISRFELRQFAFYANWSMYGHILLKSLVEKSSSAPYEQSDDSENIF